MIDNLNTTSQVAFPKCKVTHWQYNGVDFWDFRSNAPYANSVIQNALKREDKLDKVLQNLVYVPLQIDQPMLLANTHIEQSVWVLGEVLVKAGTTII